MPDSNSTKFTFDGDVKGFKKAQQEVTKGLDRMAGTAENTSKRYSDALKNTNHYINMLGNTAKRNNEKIRDSMSGINATFSKLTRTTQNLDSQFSATGKTMSDYQQNMIHNTKLFNAAVDRLLMSIAKFSTGSNDVKILSDSVETLKEDLNSDVPSTFLKETIDTVKNASSTIDNATTNIDENISSVRLQESKLTDTLDLQTQATARLAVASKEASTQEAIDNARELLGISKKTEALKNLEKVVTKTSPKGDETTTITNQTVTTSQLTATHEAYKAITNDIAKLESATNATHTRFEQFNLQLNSVNNEAKLLSANMKMVALESYNTTNATNTTRASLALHRMELAGLITANQKAELTQRLANITQDQAVNKQLATAASTRLLSIEETIANEEKAKLIKKTQEQNNSTNEVNSTSKKYSKTLEDQAAMLRKLKNDTKDVTEENDKLNKSFKSSDSTVGSVLTKLSTTAAKVAAVVKTGSLIGSGITSAMSYIETVNLFAATMGEATDSAKEFIETMAGNLGLDPVELMKTQGTFNILIKSIGNTVKSSETMSQGLTQLAVDWASLRDMDVSETVNKLESGIVGITRSIRFLGIDVSMAALQNEALLLGLDIDVERLDQASKMQLRYSAIMRQSAVAMSDFARTAEQPANQFRILKEQLAVTSRTLGSIFVPMLSKVLPYLIAFAKLLTTVFAAIAKVVGFNEFVEQAEENAEHAKGGIKSLSEEMEELEESTTATGKAIRNIQGFDELNRLGSGDAIKGAIGGLQTLDLGLDSYDMKFEGFKLKAEEIVETVQAMWREFQTTRPYEIFRTVLWDLYKVLGWLYENVLKPVGEWFFNTLLPVAIETVANMFDFLQEVLIDLTPTLEWIWFNLLVPLGNWVADNIVAQLELLGAAFGLAAEDMRDSKNDANEWLLVFGGLPGKIAYITQLLKAAWNDLDAEQKNGVVKTFGKILEGYDDFVFNVHITLAKFIVKIGEAFNKLVDIYNDIATFSNKVFDTNIQMQAKLDLTRWSEGIEKAIARHEAEDYPTAPVKQWLPTGTDGGVPDPYGGFYTPMASGGVVAPRNPFLAMLGDNLHVPEIVSPVPTMKQAMYDVLSTAPLYSSMFSPPKVYSTPIEKQKTNTQQTVSEDMLYRAVARAVREMPVPMLAMDGEIIARKVTSSQDFIDRRYNRA